MASSTMEESKLPGGYLVTPRVPQGLAAAVEGLTREVIRHSPEDIYVFAAHHFEKLLLIREQCGPEEIAPNRDSNFRTLREMSQALRMREVDRGNTRSTRNPSDQVGWSLNQTAKVLKRHRSIFGDAGRRISTDEVFQMASQKENQSQTSKQSAERKESRTNVQRREGGRSNQKSSTQTAEELWKASTSRTDRSWSNEDSPEVSETRSGPKIITQIPSLQSSTGLLAKDIKTELRKNRISSRERRNVRAKPEDRSGIDRSDVKQAGKTPGKNVAPRKSSERLKRTETEVEKRNRKSVESTRSSKDRQNSQRTTESRAMSMDRVKDYVVQRFATTKSLEELQDLNYVEKVQGIIDETGPIIKGKVEELKSGMIGRSKRSSWFSDARNDRLKGSNDSGSDKRGSGGNSSHKDSVENSEALGQSADALRNRLTETQHLLENVSSKMTRPRRSRSARSSRRSVTSEDISACKDLGDEATASNTETLNRDNGLERRLSKTRNLLEDISSALSGPMRRSNSAKSLRRQEDEDLSDLGAKDALKTRLDETRNLLEGISATFAMPGHRVGSSKGRRRRASGNVASEEISFSDSQNSSKVSLPAVRSASAKNSSGSVSRSDSVNLVLPAISPEAPKSKKVKEDLVLPVLSPPGTGSSNDGSKIGDDDVFAEEDIPEIPVEDYIPDAIVEDVFRDSLNVTPNFDNIPQRPDSLEPLETIEDIEATTKSNNLEERLQEIQKVEKDIQKVFTSKTSNDPQHSEELPDSGMKKKLEELEEAEKRIESIFGSEVCKDNEDSPKSETKVDASLDDVAGSSESGRNVEEEIVPERDSARESEVNDGTEDEEKKDDDQGSSNLLITSPETLNYTYVLSEGSPYEIPDTVTTVIIPERTFESPESDRLDVVLEDGEEAKLTLVSGDVVRKGSKEIEVIDEKVTEEIDEKVTEEIDGKVVEEIDGKIVEAIEGKVVEEIDGKVVEEIDGKVVDEIDETVVEEIDGKVAEEIDGKVVEEIDEKIIEPINEDDKTAVDTTTEVSSQPKPKSPTDHDDMGKKSSSTSPKNGSNENDSSLKKESDPFGEVVEPEPIELTSPDIDFIRGIESRQEIHISHQDLDSINEEMSEELEEGLEDTEEAAENPVDPISQKNKEDDEDKKAEIIETVAETKKEDTGRSHSPDTHTEKEDNEDKKLEADEAIKTPKTIEATVEIKEEDSKQAASCPESPVIHPENEDDEVQKSEVDKSKVKTESDLSPEAFRQNLESSSSNEAKESSGPDEPLETAKCANSADEEESSDTRSPESSNEVKETTLTDGLSLSLDPTRPFVPELNLDSLQDITVSSFKMTEDEYENQGHAESGNTNSITETLTSDENHRILEATELPEEAVMEYLVSSSDRSKLEVAEASLPEVVEEPIVKSQVEIKEDICIKSNAYVTGPDNKEDNLAEVHEETQSAKEDNKRGDSAKSFAEDKKEEIEQQNAEQKSSTEQDDMENLDVQKMEHEDVPEEKEDIAKSSAEDEKDESAGHKSPTELEKVDDLVAEGVEHEDVTEEKEDAPKSPAGNAEESQTEIDEEAKEDKTEQQSLTEQEETENLATAKENRKDSEENKLEHSEEEKKEELPDTEDKDDISTEDKSDAKSATSEVKKNDEIKEDDGRSSESAKSDDKSSTSEVKKNEKIKEDDSRSSKSAKSDGESATSEVKKNEEIEDDSRSSESAKSDDKSATSEVKKNEEIEDDSSSSESAKSDAKSATPEVKKTEEIKEDDISESAIVEDSEIVNQKMEDRAKSADMSGEIRSVEEGSDEILEESFVEEDTPLAVSRSASQCTTRRVSSGNLAKLREDSTLGWTEETEQEIGNEEEGSSSKLKFSKIGGETIKEQGSDEIDQSQDSESPKNISDNANGNLTKDSKEYHIYVPEVDASDGNSTTESSTVDSAVTKIQARVRGFLTRRRFHRGQHNRSSTLSSIPSIQDSIVVEPYNVDGHQPETEGQRTEETTDKTNIPSSLILDEPGLENAATRIQSNYRGYKARKRLKREDAVQRTTLSLEKSFAESGLQHTGEFHDCIPLPLHDLASEKKSPNSIGKKFDSISQKSPSSSSGDKEISSGSKDMEEHVEKGFEMTEGNLEDHQNHGKMFFGQSPNVPVIQFGMIPNISHLVDLVALAKGEAALESSYLNFITSVEDTEVIGPESEIKTNVSDENLKEPLAFSKPPIGVVIEEITSSDIDSFLNNRPTESEIQEPKVATESSGSPKAPCASSETISESSEDPKMEEIVSEEEMAQETPESQKSSSRNEENLVLPTEEMIKDFGISKNFSSLQEKDLLGPESSVDSMECPVVGSDEKNSSRSSGEDVKSSGVKKEVEADSEEEKIIKDQKDSSSGSDVIKENTKEEEPYISNVDDVSSTLSFSLKVEDFLGLGSEDSIDVHRKKPILEVTLTPGDIMKSMSLSQESQLAGERIESPITMVQMAPARSESLQQEEPSESGCEDEGTIGKPVSPSSEKSGHK